MDLYHHTHLQDLVAMVQTQEICALRCPGGMQGALFPTSRKHELGGSFTARAWSAWTADAATAVHAGDRNGLVVGGF